MADGEIKINTKLDTTGLDKGIKDMQGKLDKAGKTILLEGQLGTLKDTDHGIYPMVTSSNTIAAYGAVGTGLPPYSIKEIYTVIKAYSSAVGAGAFVSEIFGEEAAQSFICAQKQFLGRMQNGEYFIAKCCKVAGLGGQGQRDGSYDYYMSEPIVSFDLKATGAFIQAACEYEKRTGA